MASVPLEIREKHNKLLVDLCDLIDIGAQSWTNFIGFLNNAALPAGRLQRVKHQPMDVFHLMEERGILKEGDYRALEEALKACVIQPALDLVHKVGSEITTKMKEQGSATIATQGTSAAGHDPPSYKKKNIATQGTIAEGDDSPSNKKKKIDDNDDAQMEETDTAAAIKVVTPAPQPPLSSQRTPQSIQIVTPTLQPVLISQRKSQSIPTQPVEEVSLIRLQLTPFVIGGQASPLGEEGQSGAEGEMESQGQARQSTATQGTSAEGDDSPSKKKKKIDDNDDAQMEETDTAAAIKVVTPAPQPPLSSQRTPQSIQIVTRTLQPVVISQRKSQSIPTQPVEEVSLIRSQLTPFEIGGQASPLGEEKQSGAEGEMESQGQARQSTDLQNEDEFLEAIRNNDQMVEEFIKHQKIPKESVMEEAMKQDRYSKGLQRALIEMSKLLRTNISEAVCVWCGYRPEKPYTPVFVVTLKDQKCILKKEEIPEPFNDYTIITRHKYVPNDEEKSIVEQYGNKSVRSEDITRVNKCIAIHTASLMKEHSNLSIIRPCPIKACGYMKKKMEVIEDTCIVFYVPVKGIIPVGENEFPKVLDGIYTDVREGEFLLFGGHNAMDYHPKLQIGCGITSGCKTWSLGGFVDLSDGKVGCLTAAHVVLTDDVILKHTLKADEEKKRWNNCLAEGEEQIEIHQPDSVLAYKPFGKVRTIALEAGNDYTPSVDAAIIEITDDGRKPETGSFSAGDFKDFGLTKEDPLLFTSGEILDDTETHQNEPMVIKFGCLTGLTSGYLNRSESCVRTVTMDRDYCFPLMFGQLEVSNQNHDFALKGDSGALVFICVGKNIQRLRAVGMVIGGNTAGGTCFITPIKTVFEKLGLASNKFKVFPASRSSRVNEDIGIPRHAYSEQNETFKKLSEEVNFIKQKVTKMDTIEEDIKSIKELLFQMSNRS